MADARLQTYSTASTSAEEMCSTNDPTADESNTSFKVKKLKSSDENELFEERLNKILCCPVCLDLPETAAIQCRNGHLMCSQCFNHLLADVKPAVCPICRSPISKDSCVRNLVVEKVISELPMKCKICRMKFPRALRDVHEKQLCLERQTTCCYYRIGCLWNGPYKKKGDHEKQCTQLQKTGAEIMQTIPPTFPEKRPVTISILTTNHLCDYLSSKKIQYNDLMLVAPYRPDGYFETFGFNAFGIQWEVKAYVNNKADPPLSTKRTLKYQLLLKETLDRSIHMHYTIVSSPSEEMKIRPHIEEFTFTSKTPESHFSLLPLEDSIESYRLLSKALIKFRLIMFWDDCEEF